MPLYRDPYRAVYQSESAPLSRRFARRLSICARACILISAPINCYVLLLWPAVLRRGGRLLQLLTRYLTDNLHLFLIGRYLNK